MLQCLTITDFYKEITDNNHFLVYFLHSKKTTESRKRVPDSYIDRIIKKPVFLEEIEASSPNQRHFDAI